MTTSVRILLSLFWRKRFSKVCSKFAMFKNYFTGTCNVDGATFELTLITHSDTQELFLSNI